MKQLMKGNEAVIHGALLGGATHFFGYPITPASEIAHAGADLFNKTGRHFLQAESEVAAINMLYGAAGAGARVMTASSGPGISLMAEGISYMAGSELPCVIIDVQRAGPGLGNIWPEQSDYNAVVKGGGHGNYRNVVLAPNSAQEMCDFTFQAFEMADRYRATVIVLTDAYVGQMMEKSMSDHNLALKAKYEQMEAEITDWEEVDAEDAELLIVAFGISARISLTATQRLRANGLKVGLLRPKTLFPFPRKRLAELGRAGVLKRAAVVELNTGMMAEDVQLALPDAVEVTRCNWLGGEVPTTEDVMEEVVAGFADVAGAVR